MTEEIDYLTEPRFKAFLKEQKLLSPFIEKAIRLIKQHYHSHTRISGKEYPEGHFYPVAYSLTINNPHLINENYILTALLHDIVEDGKVTISKIKELFTHEISENISVLSKPKNSQTPTHERDREYFESIYKLNRLAVTLVKLEDRINNLLDLDAIIDTNPIKASKKIHETYTYVMPLADSLPDNKSHLYRQRLQRLLKKNTQYLLEKSPFSVPALNT